MRDPRLHDSPAPNTSRAPPHPDMPSRSSRTRTHALADAATYLPSLDWREQVYYSQHTRVRQDSSPFLPQQPPPRWERERAELEPTATHPHQPRTVYGPPPVHRVYILHCASCQTFLSDRGMRAVLLLKPNIILFSTDCFPSNASILWPEATELPSAERTCQCLTSAISCHGCGTTVGYQIVRPCERCTASVQRYQHSANHHRYVFHLNEVVASERRCIEGEAGVIQSTRPRPRNGSPTPYSRSPSPSTSPDSLAIPSDHKDAASFPSLSAETGRQASPAPPFMQGGVHHGDVVYWHHLVGGGERARPVDTSSDPPTFSFAERAGR